MCVAVGCRVRRVWTVLAARCSVCVLSYPFTRIRATTIVEVLKHSGGLLRRGWANRRRQMSRLQLVEAFSVISRLTPLALVCMVPYVVWQKC